MDKARAWKNVHNTPGTFQTGSGEVDYPEAISKHIFSTSNFPYSLIFKNMCLIVAVFCGFILNHYLNDPLSDLGQKWKLIKSLEKDNRSGKISAKYLEREIDILLLKLDLKRAECTNMSKVAPLLAEHFNVNIVIYKHEVAMSMVPMFLFPMSFDEARPTISLICSTNDPINHIDLIRDISKIQCLFNKYYCFYCKSIRSYKTFRHICLRRYNTLCRSCKIHKNSPKTFINHLNKKRFCIQELDYPNDKYCDRRGCGVQFRSSKCELLHDTICPTQYFCNKCSKWSTVGKGMKTWQELEHYHDCTKKRCKICHLIADKDFHGCKISESNFPKHYANLGFINIYFTTSTFDCINCNTNNTCSFHSLNNDRIPIFAVCYFESGKNGDNSGHFKRKIWAHESIKYENKGDELQYKYSERKINRSPPPSFKNCKVTYKISSSTKLVPKLVYELLTEEEFSNTCFVTDSESLSSILEALLSLKITPKILAHGNAEILKISFPRLAPILFRNVEHFIKVKDTDYIKKFEINSEKELFFPHKVATPPFFDSCMIPEINCWIDFSDDKRILDAKNSFFGQKTHFNFGNDLADYVSFKVRVLAKVCLIFSQELLNIQKSMSKYFKKNPKNGEFWLSAFSWKCDTISSLSVEMFRIFGLRDSDVRSLPTDWNINDRNTSIGEFELISWLNFKHKIKLRSTYTHKYGQLNFSGLIPDATISSETILPDSFKYRSVFYLGCYFHNCTKIGCPTRKSPLNSKGVHNQRKINLDKIDAINDIKNFELKYPKYAPAFYIWECDWSKLRTKGEISEFLCAEKFIPRPKYGRLQPREALRGSLSYPVQLSWTDQGDPNYKTALLDISSFYPWASKFDLPTGEPKIIMREGLEELVFKNEKLWLNSCEIFGLAQVKVFPPEDLLIPYLLYKCKDKRSLSPLCANCAEKLKKKCTCNNRTWVGCYSTIDICYANLLGYRFQFLELWQWPKKQFVFKDFVNVLAREKIKSSFDLSSKGESDNLLESINSDLNLKNTPLELVSSDFSPNRRRREVCKFLLNSQIGKWSQKTLNTNFVYVQSREELCDLYQNESGEILGFPLIGKNIVIAEHLNYQRRPDKRTSAILGIWTLSIARRYFHYYLTKIQSENKLKILLFDTDGVYLAMPKDFKIDQILPIGPNIGQFKIDEDNIKGFWTLGRGNYCYSKIIEDKLSFRASVKGFSLSSFSIQDKINNKVYQEAFIAYLENRKSTLFLKQQRKKRKNLHTPSQKYTIDMKFSTCLLKTRVCVVKNSIITTEPFGYLSLCV